SPHHHRVCLCFSVFLQQQKNLEGYVGFASLPNQVYRKSVKRGFEFTLMVVGKIIKHLFIFYTHPKFSFKFYKIKKSIFWAISPTPNSYHDVRICLIPWQPVTDHIDSKFEDYLNAESRVNRRQMPDSRIHCCLYFIAPSGHGLKPLDIEFMKRLHEKVNIIPLIAKADTLTPEECQQFKKQIMREIQEHKIKIYEFPETDDEEDNKLVKKIKDRLPLAVVGSNTIIEVNGKKARGRQYPWGVAEVENGDHCDFTILRNMLIRYTIYPLAQMEEERREHVAKMKKMEMEMEQVFEMKVKEKIQKLRDSEAEVLILTKKN
uniref:Septin-7 n=1 Tax=Astyanax mexicanus TaxID=7994 RepID=A0A8B9KYK2_ASTMX